MDINTARQIFAVLLLSGIVAICIEVFVPGGILGVLGALALLGAIILGFIAFPSFGFIVGCGIIAFSLVAFLIWLKIAPRTWIGRKLTISADLSASKATSDSLADLLGRSGTATCPLRPAGFASIDSRRIDVITRGEMIDKGARVRVVDVESNRVVVKAIGVEQQE